MMARSCWSRLSVGSTPCLTRQISGLTRQIRRLRHSLRADACYLSGRRPYLSGHAIALPDRKKFHRMAASSQLTPYERSPRAICRVSGEIELGK